MADKSSWHIVTGVDTLTRKATCSRCGEIRASIVRRVGKTPYFICNIKQAENDRRHKDNRLAAGRPKSPSQRFKKRKYRRDVNLSTCAGCGFIPVDECQMDVDHINQDHADNTPENLQALCANCHRLKTKKENLLRRCMIDISTKRE